MKIRGLAWTLAASRPWGGLLREFLKVDTNVGPKLKECWKKSTHEVHFGYWKESKQQLPIDMRVPKGFRHLRDLIGRGYCLFRNGRKQMSISCLVIVVLSTIFALGFQRYATKDRCWKSHLSSKLRFHIKTELELHFHRKSCEIQSDRSHAGRRQNLVWTNLGVVRGAVELIVKVEVGFALQVGPELFQG